MSELLPGSTKPAPVPLVLFKAGKNDIVFNPKKMEKKIYNAQIWLQAFGAYAAVLSTKFPNHAPELYQYMVDILNLAHLYSWELVSAYDVTDFLFKIIHQNPMH